MKTCPFCAEEIQDAATVCKHCGNKMETKQDRYNKVGKTISSIGLILTICVTCPILIYFFFNLGR